MEIRAVTAADDRMEISRVYERSWKFAYKGIIPQDYLDSIPEGRWAPNVDREGWRTLVCVEDGEIVGTSSFCASRFEQFPGWGEIISLYLLPEQIGKGRGRALMDAALAALKEQGFEKVFLWVLEENTRARKFYERYGFTAAGDVLESDIGGKTLREVRYVYEGRERTVSMDRFQEALLSPTRNPIIPEEDDWYAPLLGDWRFDYSEPGGRQLKGEWFFRRVLEGTAIEDIFICPSRDTKEENPQPDGEYGVAVRMYNQAKRCYDMSYACTKYTKRLEVRREQEKIVCTVQDDPTEKWVFLRVTEDAFHWQNVSVLEDGTWRVNCEVFATRMG